MPSRPLPPQHEAPSVAQVHRTRGSPEHLREYLVHLDHTQLSEAQKLEVLQALWSIMSTLVDLAFGTDPVQQALSDRVRPGPLNPIDPAGNPAGPE
jgi:hypothetical protein